MKTFKGKKGGYGGPWIEFDSAKPPRVGDHYKFWSDAPPEISERAQWWLRQIKRGWKPNRNTLNCCYDCNAEWLGVYIWEWTNVLYPALSARTHIEYGYRPPPVQGPKTLDQTMREFISGEMRVAYSKAVDDMLLYGNGGNPAEAMVPELKKQKSGMMYFTTTPPSKDVGGFLKKVMKDVPPGVTYIEFSNEADGR